MFTSGSDKIKNVRFTTESQRNHGGGVYEEKSYADLKTALIYLIISIFLAAAGAVYEHFSFGVYSYYMIYAFAIPLIGGTLPFLIRYLRRVKQNEYHGKKHTANAKQHITAELYHAAVAILTVGSIVQGALAICGRPNSLTIVYPIAAAVLLIMTAAMRCYFNTRSIMADAMPTSMPAAMPLNKSTGK